MFWEGKALSSSIYVPTEKIGKQIDWSRFYKPHLVTEETPPIIRLFEKIATPVWLY